MGHFYPILGQKCLILLVLGIHIKDVSEILHYGRVIKVNKGDNCKYAQKTPVGTEIGHFYTKLGPKPGTPCSPSSLKKDSFEILEDDKPQ